jgi:hypothetical protein
MLTVLALIERKEDELDLAEYESYLGMICRPLRDMTTKEVEE